MMAKIATFEDKKYDAVITPSAISKNEIYKNIQPQPTSVANT